jgi:hypothetical protein
MAWCPVDYWLFPAVLRSFENTGYGKIEYHNGLRWRVRGGDCVLLVPPCSAGLPMLPPGANRDRARSLMWSLKRLTDVPHKLEGYSYSAPPDWQPDPGTDRVQRRGGKQGLTIESATSDELYGLLDRWHTQKKAHKPSTMVLKLHYASMITEPAIRFVCYRDQGALVGAFGYCMYKGQAAIAFAKHEYGTWWLSRYLWICTIRLLLEEGARGVVCGTSADRLKRELGLRRDKVYRVNFKAGK